MYLLPLAIPEGKVCIRQPLMLIAVPTPARTLRQAIYRLAVKCVTRGSLVFESTSSLTCQFVIMAPVVTAAIPMHYPRISFRRDTHTLRLPKPQHAARIETPQLEKPTDT